MNQSNKKTKKIAIYGKGGIGKSTTVSNIATAYSNLNKDVMVIGCDPKADTTRTLMGRRLPTILNTIKEKKSPQLNDIIFKGFNNVLCVESGGPEPGVGCAGRGIIVAMNLLEKIHGISDNLDLILYDVLGDVVCGGFAVPLREEYADEVYIVSSGEYMSLYAANNISKGVKKLKGKLAGIILNSKGISNEAKIVNDFAKKLSTTLVGVIPRNELVQKSEIEAKTVVEKFPQSNQAKSYENLIIDMINNKNLSTPSPFDDDEFEEFFLNYSKE
ncbi:Ni-sirohydrochlorin a,c-diamide reductive cyclase ATP-dependent reductase subunit [Methanobrevibacter curvatus]|uniref:Nitrogenase iron protein 1 n=1 Tax=Methanobrevibacter curvatus TaxID=49547 RepID=A0A166AB25_9EURY|nr:Ni-sirohydrochlorin a,c-diamide reductive cyclase ATP-dependent reductase subunit [Methanobrevibacter curvatus]KZX11806.1 nitrogenase iron protein 1 [Methanobrevibacter curvatus]